MLSDENEDRMDKMFELMWAAVETAKVSDSLVASEIRNDREGKISDGVGDAQIDAHVEARQAVDDYLRARFFLFVREAEEDKRRKGG